MTNLDEIERFIDESAMRGKSKPTDPVVTKFINETKRTDSLHSEVRH